MKKLYIALSIINLILLYLYLAHTTVDVHPYSQLERI